MVPNLSAMNMNKKLVNSLVDFGSAALSTLLNTPTDREKELERQMALLRLEQQKIQSEKIQQQARQDKIDMLTVMIRSQADALHEIDCAFQSISVVEEEEMKALKIKYDNMRKPHLEKQKLIEHDIKMNREELAELEGRKIQQPMPGASLRRLEALERNKAPLLAREFNVDIHKCPNGAAEMYALVTPLGGIISFETLSQRGPPHQPKFTCQLIISFAMRSKPLNIIMQYEGLNKKDMKNDMCGSIVKQTSEWIADLSMCGDVHLHPGPYVKLRFYIHAMNVEVYKRIDDIDFDEDQAHGDPMLAMFAMKAMHPGLTIYSMQYEIEMIKTLTIQGFPAEVMGRMYDVGGYSDQIKCRLIGILYDLFFSFIAKVTGSMWRIKIEFADLMITCGTQDEKSRARFENVLRLRAGIEEDPGPAMSKEYRFQTKTARKRAHRDKNRLNKGTFKMPEKAPDEMMIGEDPIMEPTRCKYFRTQKDEKNKRMERDYRSQHRRLKNSQYSGELKDDMLDFYKYLDEHGYASNQSHKLPPWFIQRIFEKWAREGRLVSADQAGHIYRKYENFTLSAKFTPQYKSRKLILKAFVAYNAMIDTFSYLRMFLSSTTRMPSTIGLTLKDVGNAQKRIKQKGMKWADMRDVKAQMFGNAIGSTLRSAGRSVAEGMTEVVMPVLNKVTDAVKSLYNSLPSLSNILLIVKIIGIVLMIAILGWAIVTLVRTLTMGIDSFMPIELGQMDDLSHVQPQHFSYSVIKATATGWAESFDQGIANFNNAFSNAEIVKLTKTIGNFSTAVKNVEWLLAKIKEIFVYIVNKTCKVFSGRPFFQDARNVQELQTKIEQIMATVNVTDISQMVDTQKAQYVEAYMDLVEMYPFVFRVDKTLGAMIQTVIAKSQPLYKQCVFYLKTNISRMQPYHISLQGPPGKGKTILMYHLIRMIYDACKVINLNVWKQLFYNGGEHSPYTRALIYERKAEQEFWDNYNNQPITVLDDLGQAKDQESRQAEFFSIIRMINNSPYPLHMADILRKDSTVFSSKLVCTTTNMPEHLFTDGELGIQAPEAFTRRRDIVFIVDRDDGWVKKGDQSVEYLNTFRLKVYYPDKVTGTLGPTQTVEGYAAITQLANDMAVELIDRYNKFTGTSDMDHSNRMAEITVEDRNVIKDDEWFEYNTTMDDEVNKRVKIALEAAMNEQQEIVFKQAMNESNKLLKQAADAMPEYKDEIEPLIDADFDESDDEGTGVGLTEEEKKEKDFIAKKSFIPGLDVVYEDLCKAKPQMWKVHKIVPAIRNYMNPVHPEMTTCLRAATGKIITTYDAAQLTIQELRRGKDPKKWMNKGFDHDFIVYGFGGMSRFVTFLKFEMGLFKDPSKLPKGFYIHRDVVATLVQEYPDIPVRHIDKYLGLSNPIYYALGNKYTRYKELWMKVTEDEVITYDDVMDNEGSSIKGDFRFGQYKELIEFEAKHELALRGTKGNSFLAVYVNKFLMIVGAFVGLALIIVAAVTLYKSMDPTREIDTEFVTIQSSDPRLNRNQQRAARARNLPKQKMTNLAKAKPQFSDDNATAIAHKIRKNVLTFRADTPTHELFSRAFGIEDSIVCVPAHMISKKPTKIYLSEADGSKEYEFDFSQCKYEHVRPMEGYSTADLVLVHVPGLRNVKKITHLLFKESDNIKYAQGCSLFRKTDEGYDRIESPSPINVVSSQNYLGSLKVREIAKINLSENTDNGDCCEPYVFFNTAMERKIGLLHIGLMDTGITLAGRLNQEDVEKFKKSLDVNLSKVHAQVRSLELDFEPIILQQHREYLKFDAEKTSCVYGLNTVGTFSKKFASPTKSQIIPTPMCLPCKVIENGEFVVKQPPFPIEGAPAMLREKNGLNPMDIGLEGCKKRKIIYGGYLREEDYGGIFNNALRNCSGRILPLWEAIKGIRNHPKSHSIKRSTSAAFYHKLFNKLKREYVDLSEAEFEKRKDIEKENMIYLGHEVWLHKDILELVTIWFKLLKQKKISLNWVIAMLKDEIRPLDRVQACKTRVFYAGNFAFLIICRMIMGEFVTELETNWAETDIAVGVNPYSCGWAWIFEKICKHGYLVKDDDTQKWDQNFPTTEFINTFPDAYLKYFDLYDKSALIDLIFITIEIQIVDLVYGSVIANFHCMVVIGADVFFFVLQASGVEWTTIFNSICNSACNRCIIRIVVRKPFDEVASMWTYGDDLLLNCPLITREEMWRWAKFMFNHIRTDPAKNLEAKDTNIFDAFFLQRQFRRGPVLMCPLNIKSIHNMLQWIDKPKDKSKEAQFAINCKTALMELSRHGKEVYEKYQKEINFYLARQGSSYVIHTSFEEAAMDIVLRALF